MLKSLFIRNFVLIDSLDIKFDKGFSVKAILTVNVDYFNNAHKSIDKQLKDFRFQLIPRKDGGNHIKM